MNTNSKNIGNIELIAKYLANEMTKTEANEFEAKIEHDKNEKFLFNAMQKDWNKIGSYKAGRSIDTNKAWDKLYGKLEDERLIINAPETIHASFTRRFVQYAAVALLLITVGITFFTLNPFGNEKLMVLQTSEETGTLVQTLQDGSVVYIAGNTELTFPEKFKGKKRKVTLNGEAFFDINRNPQKPFVIEANNIIVEVLGTSFNLKSNAEGVFELIVETGLVKVSQKDNPSNTILIGAGETATFANNVIVKKSTLRNRYNSWRLNRMSFKDEKLENIIQVINKNYNSNIVLASGAIGERRMTVTFFDNSLETITDLICKTMVLKAEHEGETIILMEK
ncbi:MAG TPA: FecR domain-containing protein [Tenuifilaceae bacterium]|nr:FecR domain-containing protein [Tenuifilaceae bacterium]